jgi:hypothetical protein
MPSAVQRKTQYLTFQKNKPEGFPEFLGSVKIGSLQCCYFFKGIRFPRGRYEFEITTITIPAGFALVNDDGTIGAPTTEPFIMPLLVDVVPEGGQASFPYTEWHFCLSGGGDFGTIACAKPLLGSGTKKTRNTSLHQKQIIFFYDDSDNLMVPPISKNPFIPRDPNNRYYFIPMLLPNQSICFYLLPEQVEIREGIIKKWNDNIVQLVGTAFFVGVEKQLIFSDDLQIFFSDEVKPFWMTGEDVGPAG